MCYYVQLTWNFMNEITMQLTQVIADKEKKSSTFKDGKLDALSEEKTTKIKKFAKEYIAKILRKLEKSKRDPHHRPPSSTMSTLASGDGSLLLTTRKGEKGKGKGEKVKQRKLRRHLLPIMLGCYILDRPSRVSRRCQRTNGNGCCNINIGVLRLTPVDSQSLKCCLAKAAQLYWWTIL